MKNCGFSKQEAKEIEANYHRLYTQSDKWVETKLKECCSTGYATVAFGLRIRTPMLAKTYLNTDITPYLASAEGRSVANAISGQSFGLLTNRAINALMEKVWNSEYKTDILPICLIHDAIYLLIKDDIDVLKYVNDNLIKEMQWQELDEIKHDDVHLEAELDLFHPDWSNPITLKNNLNQQQIKDTIKSCL